MTLREKEIVTLISSNHSTKKIADLLTISPLTVRKHRANILSKLDLSSSAALIAYAKRGIRDSGARYRDKLSILTAREREIIALSAQGLTSKEVARLLRISFHTVEKHRENIFRKLSVRRIYNIFDLF